MSVAIIAPVYRTGAFLEELVRRLEEGMTESWTLRLVDDACPDGGGSIADSLAARSARVRVTHLARNVGQHRALARGLRDEEDADAWVCIDSDLQDPPEALSALLAALSPGSGAAVFAGRRGEYESRGRRLTGSAHRTLIAGLVGLPRDAGAFFAMDRRVRDAVISAVLDRDCPSVVVAAGASRLPLVSIPIARSRRPHGRSAWTSSARARQSFRSVAWSIRNSRSSASLRRQVVSFTLIGGAGTLAFFAVYAALRFVLPPDAANVAGRVIVAIPSTWAHGRVTFGARVSLRRLLVGTVVTLALTSIVTTAVLQLEQTVAGPDDVVAEATAVVVGQIGAVAVRFVTLRRWIFRDPAVPRPFTARPQSPVTRQRTGTTT